MADELELGPVDYLVIEFPGNKMTGEGFPILVDLVERGIIRILDLAFITRGADGAIDAVDIRDFDGAGIGQLAVFHRDGEPGLLDQGDLDEIGAVLDLNSSAGILVFENSWAAPFAGAMRRSGGQLVASGRIPVTDLLSAIEAFEAQG
ncbi:MAG TPA: DUF6325 family protein [Coriobacteriia bacterium]|jgi:hypothetical protein